MRFWQTYADAAKHASDNAKIRGVSYYVFAILKHVYPVPVASGYVTGDYLPMGFKPLSYLCFTPDGKWTYHPAATKEDTAE